MNSRTAALVANQLVKDYAGFSSRWERLAAAASSGLFAGSRRFRSLDDISFTLEPGQLVGVIGPNGAGKSTLLRLLCGLSTPTRGTVSFRGSVRTILELGVGFHAELTARDNILYNGLLWGYSQSTLVQDVDAILDFAGLRRFADEPLRTLSTGMQMRLAFSLATHQPADLLLVDEALAVGDASFQQRCFERFRNFRDQGSIILVVSHDLAMMADLSDQMILLERGRLVAQGRPSDVISAYMQTVARSSFSSGRSTDGMSPGAQLDGAVDNPAEDLSYTLRLVDAKGVERDVWFAGERAVLEIAVRAPQHLEDITIGFHFRDAKGLGVFGTNTHLMGKSVSLRAKTTHVFHCQIRLNAGPGAYTCGLSVHRGRTHASDCYVWKDALIDLRIEGEPGRLSDGIAFFEPVWEDNP